MKKILQLLMTILLILFIFSCKDKKVQKDCRPIFFRDYKSTFLSVKKDFQFHIDSIVKIGDSICGYQMESYIGNRDTNEFYFKGKIFWRDTSVYLMPYNSNDVFLLLYFGDKKEYIRTYKAKIKRLGQFYITSITIRLEAKNMTRYGNVYKYRFKNVAWRENDLVLFVEKRNGIIGAYFNIWDKDAEGKNHEIIIYIQGDILLTDIDYSNVQFGFKGRHLL